jgi:hypothetical protein
MLYWILAYPFFFKSTEQGASTTIYTATHPDAIRGAGLYFENTNIAQNQPHPEWMENEEIRNKFWKTTMDLIISKE